MHCDCSGIHIISKSKKRLHSITQLLEAANYCITQSDNVDSIPSQIITQSQAIIVDCVEDFLLLDKLGKSSRGMSNILALIKNSYKNKQYIYSQGAYDYISCPVTTEEVVRRLQPLITTKIQVGITAHNDLWDSMEIGSSHDQIAVVVNETKYLDEKEKDLVSRACVYLTKNICNEHSLDTLSRVVGTNRTSLCVAFRNVYGRTVFSWLRELRMKEASRLLKNTELSIQQVCVEVGYKDPANFSTAFKKYSGISPRKYRNN